LVEECWLIGGGELGGAELRWTFMCGVLKVPCAAYGAIWVRRRLMKKATMLAVMPRQANPPTTPPAIAPALDFLAEPMPPDTEAVGVAVLSTVLGG
jgi:hypothetical protein